MRVVGVKMVHLTFARGFAVELGAAIVIVVASKYGLPVSSTQVCYFVSVLANLLFLALFMPAVADRLPCSTLCCDLTYRL